MSSTYLLFPISDLVLCILAVMNLERWYILSPSKSGAMLCVSQVSIPSRHANLVDFRYPDGHVSFQVTKSGGSFVPCTMTIHDGNVHNNIVV